MADPRRSTSSSYWGSVMNDTEHNFIDIVSTERILQWKAAVQELIKVGFVMEFLLDHLQEIA